jgi:hypothetical protein
MLRQVSSGARCPTRGGLANGRWEAVRRKHCATGCHVTARTGRHHGWLGCSSVLLLHLMLSGIRRVTCPRCRGWDVHWSLSRSSWWRLHRRSVDVRRCIRDHRACGSCHRRCWLSRWTWRRVQVWSQVRYYHSFQATRRRRRCRFRDISGCTRFHIARRKWPPQPQPNAVQ